MITMRKTSEEEYAPPKFEDRDEKVEGEGHVPAHRDFRDKYFNKFGKDDGAEGVAPATTPGSTSVAV